MTVPNYDVQGVLTHVQQALASAAPGRLRMPGLKALVDVGAIQHESDLVGLSKVMRDLPGPFPNGPVNDPNQLEQFFGYIQAFGQMNPVGAGGGRLAVVGADLSGRDLFGLLTESATANAAARTTDTKTVDLMIPLDDVTLWFDTAEGIVDSITSITVDSITYYLGPAAEIPTLVADLSLNPHPERSGIYIPRINKQIIIVVGLKPFNQDITWRAVARARPDSSAMGGKLNFLRLTPPGR